MTDNIYLLFLPDLNTFMNGAFPGYIGETIWLKLLTHMATHVTVDTKRLLLRTFRKARLYLEYPLDRCTPVDNLKSAYN